MTNIYTALAQLQQECPTIAKAETGYRYNYASLESILKIVNPLLAKHGLGFSQPLDGKSVKTILFHIESGDVLESSVEIPQDVQLAKMNQFQVLGSAITYLRRYSLASILGLVTEDNDASGEQIAGNNTIKPITKQDNDVRI